MAVFKDLAGNIDEVFFLLRADTLKPIYVSPVCREIFGVDPAGDDLSLERLLETADDADREDLARECARLQRDPSLRLERVFSIQRRGQPLWVRIRTFPVADSSGEVRRIAGTAANVSDQIRAQEAMRLTSSRILAAQEKERLRISRDLHDATAQSLSSVKLLVESALAALDGRVEPARLAPLMKAVSVSRLAIAEVRRIIMNLRPTLLDDHGLGAAADWLARETARDNPQITLDMELSLEESALSDLQRTVIFRVLQESLGNAARHSGASNVRVRLVRRNAQAELTVADDGQGFDPARRLASSIGLDSMRERLELVHGELQVESPPGRGTTVTARIPLLPSHS